LIKGSVAGAKLAGQLQNNKRIQSNKR
jgi:hypothetical protein